MFGDPHTHTTMAGAVLSAECVVSGLRALPRHPLDKYLSAKGQSHQALQSLTPGTGPFAILHRGRCCALRCH